MMCDTTQNTTLRDTTQQHILRNKIMENRCKLFIGILLYVCIQNMQASFLKGQFWVQYKFSLSTAYWLPQKYILIALQLL